MAIVATTIVYHFEYKWQCVNNMYLYKWDNFNQLNKKNEQDVFMHSQAQLKAQLGKTIY